MMEKELKITASGVKDGYQAKITFFGKRFGKDDFFNGYHEIESDAPERLISQWQEKMYHEAIATDYQPNPRASMPGMIEKVQLLIYRFFRGMERAGLTHENLQEPAYSVPCFSYIQATNLPSLF